MALVFSYEGFGAGLFWGGSGGSGSGNFIYELSKIRSNTCTSTCRSFCFVLFTLENTSNDVKFHVISCNFREFLNKHLRWSRSRAKVTAPAPAKYPGSGRLRLRKSVSYSKNHFGTKKM